MDFLYISILGWQRAVSEDGIIIGTGVCVHARTHPGQLRLRTENGSKLKSDRLRAQQ